MSSGTDLLEQITNLRTGGSTAKPRLHKPLLVALLLARFLKSGLTDASFREIQDELSLLIAKYSPAASNPRPVYPFWRLQNDGFWRIKDAGNIALHSSGDPSAKSLTDDHRGSWTPSAIECLRDGGAGDLLTALLRKYFAAADHDQIRTDLGLAP
jgi:putative restriction endonuclease